MKLLSTACLLLALLLGTTGAQAQTNPACGQTNAPDGWGYFWRSDTTPSGPSYNWIDIKGRPGVLNITGLSDDNFSPVLNFNFSFPYYWNNYTSAYLGSNGYLMFGQAINIASGATGFPQVPTPSSGAGSATNFIAPMLCDLTFTDVNGAAIPGAGAYFWTNSVDTAIFTWENVPFWTRTNTDHHQGSNTFQIIISKNDSAITINYKDQQGVVDPAYTQAGDIFVARGIENVTGSIGLCFNTNQYPTAGTSYKVYAPSSTPTISFTDAAINWVANPDNAGTFFAAKGAPYQVRAEVKNTGTAPINSPIRVTYVLRDYLQSNTILARDTTFIASLAIGATQIVSFPRKLVADTSGDYSVQVNVSAPGDQFVANDNFSNELIALDTLDPTPQFRFDRYQFLERDGQGDYIVPAPGAASGDGLAPLVGAFRTGVHIPLTGHPLDINQVVFGMIGTADYRMNDPSKQKHDVSFVVLKDNGPNGTPGDTVAKIRVPAADLILLTSEYAENTVDLPSPARITSGGVYISYYLEAGNDTIYYGLAEDGDGPSSFRLYEISGSVWAPHRDRANKDVALGVKAGRVVSRPAPLKNAVATLGQSYPNPNSGAAVVPFSLSAPGQADFIVRNMMGQVIEVRSLGTLPAGEHQLDLNTASYASGMYTYTLRANGMELSGRMHVNAR